MAGTLSFLAEEFGRAVALIWSGVGIAVKLNYQVMSIFVTVTSRIIQLLFLLTQKSVDLLSILFNDLLLFIGDIGNGVIAFFNTARKLGKGLMDVSIALGTSGVSAFMYIYESFCSFQSLICNLFFSGYIFIINVLHFLKYLFVLFGSSVTFAISFVPNLFILLFTSINNFLSSAYIETLFYVRNSFLLTKKSVITFVNSFIDYFSDIPPSAVLGACLGIIIIIAMKYFLPITVIRNFFRHTMNVSIFLNSAKQQITRYLICIRESFSYRQAYETREEDSNNISRENIDDNQHYDNTSVHQQYLTPQNVQNNYHNADSYLLSNTRNSIESPLARRPIKSRCRTFGLANDDTISFKKSISTKYFMKNEYPTLSHDLSRAEDLYKELESEREGKLCVICHDKTKSVILLPCRHLCLCEACRSAVIIRSNVCPMCRKPILDSIKVYV